MSHSDVRAQGTRWVGTIFKVDRNEALRACVEASCFHLQRPEPEAAHEPPSSTLLTPYTPTLLEIDLLQYCY